MACHSSFNMSLPYHGALFFLSLCEKGHFGFLCKLSHASFVVGLLIWLLLSSRCFTYEGTLVFLHVHFWRARSLEVPEGVGLGTRLCPTSQVES